MIRSTANKASPNRMIEPNLSGSNHAPTKLIDKAETAKAMAIRLATLIKKTSRGDGEAVGVRLSETCDGWCGREVQLEV